MTPSIFLITLGAILLVGLATDLLGRKTSLPRVTLLLLFGMLLGKEMLDLIPDFLTRRFELVADMALLMIGFLLGGKLSSDTLRRSGKIIVVVSICAAVATAFFIATGLMLAGMAAGLAILLGCIGSATAPAATLDTVVESGKNTPFTRILLSVVALDDAWALILFSAGTAIVGAFMAGGPEENPLLVIARDVGGAALLGAGIGFPASYLTGRIRQGQPVLTEAIGLVFLCGGLALYFDVSFLISSMIMGAVITNFARHHDYPFHAIEGIEWPFMVVFFVLAGASLELDALKHIGLAGAVYIIGRIFGKVCGAALGGRLAGMKNGPKAWLGAALLLQAGAAMGMALVASNCFPAYRETILPLVIGTTVFFELVGPIFTRTAIHRSDDWPGANSSRTDTAAP
ncbi:sodium:proton antiporter [Prosthecochloris sp. GSB1]|uniref:cation:proton antiporter n=1 Tax=Prosthecochloris sp. GSB1 TaxID=281093 RepID=UPI000B8D0773|nr:cation:proton antiporter [Prosthecochloris sp. GSB1]ASQ90763.1 sodium:proton antiporter [Prosthecochloris sp. GSB1]